MIHLHSLGQCMITLATARVLPTARLMFASALYVAVEGTKSIARDRMASLIWPDMTEEKATHALRQIFYRLRAHGMQLDGDAKEVIIPSGAVHRDYDALMAWDGNGVSDGLLERIPGGFLPGYVPTVSVPFTEWVEGHRARVNASLRRQLVAGIAAQRAAGNWPETQKLAQRCLEIDPLNEEATLAYAEAMAMDGSKALAIMQIDRYMTEIGPRAKELHLPATMLRKRISELYPLPPVIERDPPHTGREVEMGRLDGALSEVRQGHGRAFIIAGPPGIGKTRLATEFTRAAQLQGLRVVRTAMGRQDNRRPLGAWSDLVRELRRMPGALGCDPESIPFLDRLTSGASGSSASHEEERDSEYLFARIRLAIVDLVCAVASESVLILWIEDVHWMDEWSWDVMTALSRRFDKTGVMVLMTRREGEEAGSPVPGPAGAERIELRPLDDAGCRRLLAVIDTRSKGTDSEFAEWCTRTCAGNPYFLIELVRRASRNDGRFQAPPSLTKLIAQRFEDVTPLSRRVLQVAAVLGRNSTLTRIEAVLDERRITLLTSLDELAAHALLVIEGELVVCRHDLLGISALGEISQLSLKLLHHHAAKTLELEIDDESSPDFMWDCAEHWANAGERGLALEFALRCSSRAMVIGAPAAAVRMSEMALTWASRSEERASVRKLLIRALYLTREHSRLIEVATRLSADGASEVPALRNHSQEELCELDANVGCGGPANELVVRGLECTAAEGATPDHRVEAAIIVCKVASSTFMADQARIAYDRAMPLAPQAHPSLISELEMVYEGSFGAPERCGIVARHIRGSSATLLSPARRVLSLHLCSFGLYIAGDIAAAVESGLEAIALCESLQLTSALTFAVHGLARVHLAVGNVEEAESLLLRSSTLPMSEGTLTHTNQIEYNARLAFLRGDDEKGEQFLKELSGYWLNPWPRARVHHTAMRILPQIRKHRWRPPDDAIAALLAEHKVGRAFGTHDFFMLVMSYAFEARGEVARAVRLFDDYLAHYRRERGPVLPQLAERMEALAHRTSGRSPAPTVSRASRDVEDPSENIRGARPRRHQCREPISTEEN